MKINGKQFSIFNVEMAPADKTIENRGI